MPKILITGNGFDLSFGLPTGYSDFLKICKKLQSSKEFDWSDLKDDIIVLKNSENLPNSDFLDFETFKEKLNENTWFRYLSREYGINTWIDFEKHIEKALSIILAILDDIKLETFIKNGRYPIDGGILYKEDLDETQYEIYLTLIDFKIILYDEFAQIKLNPTFLKSIEKFYVDLEKEKLYENILNELNIFTSLFSDYLSNIVLPLTELSDGTIRIDLLKHIDYHFTFNYTPTFSRLISKSIPTTFIHGELEKNNIVLGINDWEQTINDRSSLIPFTKYFQKLYSGINLTFVDEIENDDKLYQFFFWGHSLDKSDSLYINEVFNKVDKINKEGATGKIVVIYHSDSSRFSIIKNLIEIRGSEDVLRKQRDGNLVFLHCESNELKKELSAPMTNRFDGLNLFFAP
ncbi:AbiH family protein [Sphingobacterium thalpophilum]|uniref:AbiH family protein n=1 Tax=Sphingobacterium thalpophilum TaxID=259 RepID=UPI003DA319E5